MTKMLYAAMLSIALTSPAPALAATTTGGKLYQMYSVDPKTPGFSLSLGTCLGYIQGVIDHEILRSRNVAADGIFCIREPVAGSRLIATVNRYLKANPARHRQMASILVSEALEAEFPCRRAG